MTNPLRVMPTASSTGRTQRPEIEVRTHFTSGPAPTRKLTVVICSLNGAEGVGRCLKALDGQTVSSAIEVIVVDDASTDDTSEIAWAQGATVVRHSTNRGPAAARNTGVGHATSPIVAFLDDDCEPSPSWAEHILDAYRDGVVGVGGAIHPQPGRGFMSGYLTRHNPLRPLELTLARSPSLRYRLRLYVTQLWKSRDSEAVRAVYALPSANMSLSRAAFDAVKGFDERFKFGGEDTDLCMRIGRALPQSQLVFIPDAVVTHHFDMTLRDTLRRSRAYGEGAARLCRKWPSVLPMVFPGPFIVLALLVLGAWLPPVIIAAIIAPQVLYPQGLRYALLNRSCASLLDPYVQLAQEACTTAGFVLSWWPTRHVFSTHAGQADR
jgi:glycosyltransferase involved in cell wall biosynthesis